MQASYQLSGIGDKLSGLKDSAIESFNEVNDSSIKAAAYFGETGKAAEDTAAVIKDVYEGGVGDSMDAVSDAVIAVKKNLKGLDQVTLTNITNQAITLDEIYGIDMNETLRGVNSLMENFGMTAQEAMDYVVAGTQNGLDKTNELGDNLAEYSGKFSQAGYSAKEYFQLLNNGLEGGAYNLDKVNDAINEVTTRLADGTIGDNIGMYSDKTQELFQKWKDGGATQKEVIDSIVSDIAGTTNQQEALNKAAQAFGTMAEDGNLKFITSLTSVGNSYDEVSGKAQGMFDATTTPAQEMEANMRKLKDSLVPLGEKLSEIANDIIPPLVSAITFVVQGFAALPAPVQIILIALGGLIVVISKIAPLILALKALGLPAALSSIGTAITGTVLPAIGSGIAAFASFLVPILPIIAAIGGVIAIGVALYKNWDTIKEKAAELASKAVEKFTELKNGAVNKVTELKNGAVNKVIELKNGAVNYITELKNGAVNRFTELKNGAVNKFTELKNGAVNKVTELKNGAVNTVTMAKNGILSKFDDIKSGISNKITSAKDTVKSAIDKIKGFFNFSWSLPKIKLPHFNISGKFSLDPPQIPKFSVSWYKKAMDTVSVLDGPTAFGYDAKTNQLLAGGEAGREVVSGEQHLIDLIGNVVHGQYDQLARQLDMLNEVVQQYFPQVIQNMDRDIILDDGTVVGKWSTKMDTQLGRVMIHKERGN